MLHKRELQPFFVSVYGYMHQCIVHCVLGHFLAKSRKLRNGVNTFNRLVIVLAQSGQIRLGAAEVMLMDAEIRNCCLDMECCCSRDRSYCIMVNCSDQDGTQERLDILNRSNDGFYIASEDLKLRGPGDFFGLRQSGDMEFKIADIFTDANLLKTVSEEVNRILERDPNLEQEEYWALRERLDVYLSKSYDKLNL